jgi:outer membrane immunogenic protein
VRNKVQNIILRGALVLAAFPFAVAAQAQSVGRTGPYLAVVAGWDQTDIGPSLPARTGVTYGLAGGYDWSLGGLVAGLEAEIAKSTVKGIISGAEQRFDRSFYLGGRVGVKASDQILVYAKAGYANGRFAGSVPYTGDGWRIGGGGELALTDQLFARAEFRYSDYGRIARGQQATAAFGWRF